MFWKKTDIDEYGMDKPDTQFYWTIIVVCGIIRFVPISSGFALVDEALNDFMVGAAASTWIAWLLDLSDCSKRNKARKEKARMVFAEYAGQVADLCYFITRRLAGLAPTAEKRTLKGWLYLLSELSTYDAATAQETRNRNYLRIRDKVKDIKSTISLLESQYVLLVETGIINTDDFRQHMTMQKELCDDICDRIGDNEVIQENIPFINDELDILVEYFRAFFPDSMPEEFSWTDAKG